MSNFSKIKLILGTKNSNKMFLIIVMNLFQTIIEILSLGLIVPIVSVIVQPELIKDQAAIFFLYEKLNSTNNIEFLKTLLIIFFFLYSLKLILSIIFKYFQLKFNFFFIKYLTQKIIRKYLYSDYEFFIKNKSSKMMSTLYTEASAFCDWYISPLIIIISETIFLISLVCLLLYADLKSTFIIISFFLIFIFVFLIITRGKIKSWGIKRQILAEKLLKNLSQIFEGIKIIKIFQKENFFLNTFIDDQKNMQLLGLQNDIVQFLPRVLLEYIVIILILGILFVSVNSNVNLINIIPIIALYSAATLRLIPTISKIMVSFQNLKFGAPAIKRMYEEINDNKNSDIQKETIKNIEEFKSIKYENISFSYGENFKNVLNNINLEINKGDIVGIIGESGSGKTTLLNIILGLLKPNSGKILIDKKEITNDYLGLRNLFSLVSQEVYLFDDTIAKNVALEKENKEIDNIKLKYALDTSQLRLMINNREDLENAEVGEKGISISGGQKQRISIARALYKNSEILVFDEATSNLDIDTENKLIKALKALEGKKTLIFVSHRPSSLELCNKIYSFDKDKDLIQIK